MINVFLYVIYQLPTMPFNFEKIYDLSLNFFLHKLGIYDLLLNNKGISEVYTTVIGAVEY